MIDIDVEKLSPMMRNYIETKEKYKDAILFYRLGDFYEMFFEDAKIASKELELVLTARKCGEGQKAPMAGIPHHAAESYISRLIKKGYKVAICEQLEDPKEAKDIVKRDVVRIITPGTVIESNILEDKTSNYIMSIVYEVNTYSLAIAEVSTGEFLATEISDSSDNGFAKVLDEVARFNPKELIVNSRLSSQEENFAKLKNLFSVFVNVKEEEFFIGELSKDYQIERTEEENQASLFEDNFAKKALVGLDKYILDTQKIDLEYFNKISLYIPSTYMALDLTARRNLEINKRTRDGSKKGSLLGVLDKTVTAMGGRLISTWLNSPLIGKNQIENRLDAVEEFKTEIMLKGTLRELLKKVYDIERISAKISFGAANARDLISLKNSIVFLPEIKKNLSKTKSVLNQQIYENLDTLEDVYEVIDKAIVDEPPITITEGGMIRPEIDAELYRLKNLGRTGKEWIANLEAEEKQKTKISTLKVGYNKIFGYYIEVSKAQISKVPSTYIRKQTLTNSERYVTPELKEKEEELLNVDEKIIKMEYDIFQLIRTEISKNIKRLQSAATNIAILDVLITFAQVAEDNLYVKPNINTQGILDISGGRHPVVEKTIPRGSFVENDTYMDSFGETVHIITGPNMSGKSTYMRQVALITLLAQVGSFVPATSANISIVDKIFTRIGATDDVSMGESTFMVEMNEVANILNNATKDSLIILDEVGRGTSTYDGISIAWAVLEYIADKSKIGAKTLFATHYHELIALEDKIEGVKNYSVDIKQQGEDVIFLHKLVKGGTDDSFGIYVAKLAGVPKETVKKAKNVLKNIEKKEFLVKEMEEGYDTANQSSMFEFKYDELLKFFNRIDINNTTPVDALKILGEIKDKLKEE